MRGYLLVINEFKDEKNCTLQFKKKLFLFLFLFLFLQLNGKDDCHEEIY